MSRLNGRVIQIEKLLADGGDEGDPFRSVHAWNAYGLLLERVAYMRLAGQLYEAGDTAGLKGLWVELSAANTQPEPTAAQLRWAVERMPAFLAEWKQQPWWNPLATCQAIREEIANGRVTLDPEIYASGKGTCRQYFMGKHMAWFYEEIRPMVDAEGWLSADKGEKWDTPHTVDELLYWLGRIEAKYQVEVRQRDGNGRGSLPH